MFSHSKVPISIALLTFLFFIFVSAAHSDDTVSFSAGLGYEAITYEETDKDIHVKSHSEVENLIATMQAGWKRYPFYIRIKAVAPFATEDATEYWLRNGTRYQSNRLAIKWYRIEANAGYSIRPWFTPYTGLRWSRWEQTRDTFIVEGSQNQAFGRVTETVRVYDIPIGCLFAYNYSEKLGIFLNLAAYIPVYSKIENSAFSDVQFKNVDGYGISSDCGIRYTINSSVSIEAQGVFGRIKRDESQWQSTDKGLDVRYPENETEYYTLSLIGTCNF